MIESMRNIFKRQPLVNNMEKVRIDLRFKFKFKFISFDLNSENISIV